MSMSVDGLVSGMDTTSIISQLMATEAAPQNALKTKLTTTQSTASAYRTVNTTILAITAAADALTSSTLTSARKASISRERSSAWWTCRQSSLRSTRVSGRNQLSGREATTSPQMAASASLSSGGDGGR